MTRVRLNLLGLGFYHIRNPKSQTKLCFWSNISVFTPRNCRDKNNTKDDEKSIDRFIDRVTLCPRRNKKCCINEQLLPYDVLRTPYLGKRGFLWRLGMSAWMKPDTGHALKALAIDVWYPRKGVTAYLSSMWSACVGLRTHVNPSKIYDVSRVEIVYLHLGTSEIASLGGTDW